MAPESAAFGSAWLPWRRPDPAAGLRLFCWPHAGGGASLYSAWRGKMPAGVELAAVQLPGRESRLGERAFDRIEPLVEAAARGLAPFFDLPFALFGHSMGARIAFELARRLRDERGLVPQHLFVSGCRAPQLARDEPALHPLDDARFVEELRRIGGMPEAVLADAELRALYLPILRADFTLVETYRYREAAPLDCPITAFGGMDDPRSSRDQLEPWAAQTTRALAVHVLRGDHFFLQARREELLAIVARALAAPRVHGAS
jgi:medium-chain acyl-[acyl-carrier-protein] hydrolase